MCSSPKPKRRSKAKTANSGGILSSMSSEKRLGFAERANQASDRRIEAKQLKREEEYRINKLMVKKRTPQNIKAKKDTSQSFFYSLLNTPFSELMRRLVS